MPNEQRFLGSARLIAICTLGSRITGLARDMALNHIYGQNWVQDAFNYGFLIPNLFRRLFGEGALSAVFVPVFTDVLANKGRPTAWILLGRVAGLMVLALTVLLILIEGLALGVSLLSASTPMRDLQISLTAVMAPFMIGVCVVALFSSILNCLGHFTVPALLPVVLNILIILGTLVVGPMFGEALEKQVFGVSACVLVAGVLQLLLILPVLRGHGVRFKWSLDRADADVQRILKLFIPVVLAQGVLLFNVFFDAQLCTKLTRGPGEPETFSMFGSEIAYPLEKGALSAVNNAQRLYQFPLGVLAISLATAAFPTFSLFATRKDLDGLRGSIADSMRLAIFVGIPSGVMLIILGEPIVRLLFEHGQFGPKETLRASGILRWYGIGMAAYCCQHILLRGFFSLEDTITPMKISCYLVIFNLALNIGLVWHPAIREAAFGISTAFTSVLHVGISIALLRRRLGGRMGATEIVASAVKTAIATAAAGYAAWGTYQWTASLDLAAHGKTLAAAADVFGPLAAAIGLYFVTCRVLGMKEPSWLFAKRVSTSVEDAD